MDTETMMIPRLNQWAATRGCNRRPPYALGVIDAINLGMAWDTRLVREMVRLCAFAPDRELDQTLAVIHALVADLAPDARADVYATTMLASVPEGGT